MNNFFKILLLTTYSSIAFAGEIYIYKDDSKGTILTNRKNDDEKLTHVKTIYKVEGDVLNWHVNCNKDRFNGDKICSIYKRNADVMLMYINNKYTIYVGKNHYPDSKSIIKIDENKPIDGLEGRFNSTLKVIEQMKNGKRAYTRYREWPHDYNKDGEVDLAGFTEALDEMKEKYSIL